MKHNSLRLGLIKVLSRLPLGVLYLLADLIYFLAYHIVHYRKKVVYHNITSSFPDLEEEEIRKIARKFYHNLADIIVESLKGLTISENEIKRRVKWQNASLWQEYYKKDVNILGLTLHQYNWEWILISAASQIPQEVIGVYKKLSSPFANNLMLHLRSRFGARPVEMNDILREIARKGDRPKIVSLVADQRPGPGSKQYWSQFLNQDAPFVLGPEQLAKFSKIPAVFVYVKKIKRGYYEVVNEVIAEPPYDTNGINVLHAYIRKCEEVIRQDPSGWLWSHKRFKFKKPG